MEVDMILVVSRPTVFTDPEFRSMITTRDGNRSQSENVFAASRPKIAGIMVVVPPVGTTSPGAMVHNLVDAAFGVFQKKIFHILAPVKGMPIREGAILFYMFSPVGPVLADAFIVKVKYNSLVFFLGYLPLAKSID
jgi:hypothetical protein